MYRRIHVDQGRRATNIATAQNYPIIRVDDAEGKDQMWGGTIEMHCSCGKHLASFVQPQSDQAHVVVAPGAILINDTERREKDPDLL